MSVKNKVRKNFGQFQCAFFSISDRRLVDICLKLTAYDVFGGNESKTVILDA